MAKAGRAAAKGTWQRSLRLPSCQFSKREEAGCGRSPANESAQEQPAPSRRRATATKLRDGSSRPIVIPQVLLVRHGAIAPFFLGGIQGCVSSRDRPVKVAIARRR